MILGLIDLRSNVPNDPMFQLSFPQPKMLDPADLSDVIAHMGAAGTSRVTMQSLSESVRKKLNPHPAGQKEENVPMMDGERVPGMQHKYRETVLFFPAEVGMRKIEKSPVPAEHK